MKNRNYTFVLINNYELIDENSINYLYQPIIGPTSVNLYKTIICESHIIKKLTKIKYKCSSKRLLSLLNIDEETLFNSFNLLEGMGLLKKMVNKTKENDIIYNIFRPIDPIDFFSNNQFNNALIKRIGWEDYELTRIIFGEEPIPIIEENYEDQTISFAEAFSDLSDVENVSDINFSVKLRKSNPLLKDLKISDVFKVFTKNNILVSEDDENLNNIIKSLYSTLKIKSKEIGEFLVDCYDYQNRAFDEQKISMLTNKIMYKSSNKSHEFSDEITSKKNQMCSYTSELYLMKLFNKQELGQEIVDMLYKLRINFVLTDPVINCILDYSYLKCKQTIQIDFIVSVAKSICQENIMNINDAMSFLKTKKSD